MVGDRHRRHVDADVLLECVLKLGVGEARIRHLQANPGCAGAWLQNEILDEHLFIKPWMIDTADDHYELDISRARDRLDWQPQRSLRATLPKMITALKRDPPGWYRTNKLNPAKVAADKPALAPEYASAVGDGASPPEMMRKHTAMMEDDH